MPKNDSESELESNFPFQGARGDALIALLGHRALAELRPLIRLSLPRNRAVEYTDAKTVSLAEAA